MSDFANINSLLSKTNSSSNDDKQRPDDATVEFNKRMEKINLQQTEKEVMQKAASLGIPHIDLTSFPVSTEALRVISEEEANSKKIVCFFYNQDQLRIGCLEYTKEIEEMGYQMGEEFHANAQIYLISQNSFAKVLEIYKTLPKIKAISKDLIITDESLKKYQEKVPRRGHCKHGHRLGFRARSIIDCSVHITLLEEDRNIPDSIHRRKAERNHGIPAILYDPVIQVVRL